MDNCHARDQCAAGAAGHGKSFFRGRSFLKAEQPAEEKNPQKEKVERYAALFGSLQTAFMDYPTEKTI